MDDVLITVLSIIIAVILLLGVTLIPIANQNDDVAKNFINATCQDWVYDAVAKRKITPDDYNSLVDKIASSGMKCEVEIEVQHIDENPTRKKTAMASADAVGENGTYTEYTTTVLDKLFR